MVLRGEESPLLSPSLPRFIILAGVTGESAELGSEDCPLGSGELVSFNPRVGLNRVGGPAGGGIAVERSTGEGVSPTISPGIPVVSFCALTAFMAGVEPILIEPLRILDVLLLPVSVSPLPAGVVRITGDWRFRARLSARSPAAGPDTSSPLLEAFLFDPRLPG